MTDSEKGFPNGEQPAKAEQPNGEGQENLYRVKVNGEEKEVTLEELQNGYSKGENYTQKMQELSKMREKLEKEGSANTPNPEGDESVQDALKVLKENGFMTSKDMEEKISSMKQESEFDSFKASYSDLLNENQITAIKALKGNIGKDKSFEEIASEYGFIDEAKLERARGNRRVMGVGIRQPDNEPSIEEIAGPPPKFLR